MDDLASGHCVSCELGQPPISLDQIQQHLQKVPEWQLNKENTVISRTFKFKGFQKTILFINALAWIINQEGHHPTLEVGYDYCTVNFTTHSAKGLTINDFICAAKIDQLLV